MLTAVSIVKFGASQKESTAISSTSKVTAADIIRNVHAPSESSRNMSHFCDSARI